VTKDILTEINSLRSLVEKLEIHADNPAELEGLLLETCTNLLAILDNGQKTKIEDGELNSPDPHQLQSMIEALEISRRNRELSALQTATATLLTTLDQEALLGRILDAATSAIPSAQKGSIHLIAQETGQLEMRATVGYQDPRIRKMRFPGNSNYATQAVQQGKPLLIHDLTTNPSTVANEIANRGEVQSVIVAPLILKKQVLGAISLASTEPGAFNENDLRLLASFAATATAAIHNSRLHQDVQKLAITDELTGLYNRRGFYELGHREVERSRRFQRPLVAIMMDVDHFKRINDTYGHPVGDQVLAAVAKRCKENLRRIDILGRFGGDEFTVLLPETDMFTGSRVAERLRLRVFENPILMGSEPLKVSMSMGIAKATATTPDLDVLMSRADSAMYRAKEKGRNRVEFG
jgi:diguanylate cyclase (GGDEF)-like protein